MTIQNLSTNNRRFLAGCIAGLTALIIVNPRIGHSEDLGVLALSCTGKSFYVQKGILDSPGGFYTTESLVDDHIHRKQVELLASGNPFAGLGLTISDGMKRPLVKMFNKGLADTCAGRMGGTMLDAVN